MRAGFCPVLTMLARLFVVACASSCCICQAGAPEHLPVPQPLVGEVALPPLTLTLEDAKGRALSVSPVLQLARLNVQEKQAALRGVHADYLPKIFGMFAVVHYDQPLGSVFTLQNGANIPVSVVNRDQNLSTISAAQPVTALLKVRGLSRVTAADGRIAQFNVEEARRAILSGVEQLYVGLWAAQRIQTVAQAANTAAKPFQHGPVDLQAAWLESLQGLQTVTGQVNQLQDQMNDLLCFTPETLLVLSDVPSYDPPVGSAEQAACLALNASPQVREATQLYEKASAALLITKTDFLPDLKLMGGYVNQNGIPAIQSNIGYASAIATYTLYDAGKRRHLTQKANLDIAMAQANIRKTRQEVVAKARKAFRTLQDAGVARDTARQLADVRKKIAAQRLEPGDALKAGKDAVSAEVAYIQSEVAYRIALAELIQLTSMH